MIFRLLLLILLPVLAYYFAKSIGRRFSLSARQNRLLFFLLASLLVIAVLIAIGRLPIHFILAPLGVAATFLIRTLPMLLRFLPMWHMFKGKAASARTAKPDQVSTIRTQFLEMELRHDDGSMDGVVLKGDFSGQRLSALALQDLLSLYAECNQDSDSAQVLEAFIDRAFPDWREQAQAQQHENEPSMDADANMTEHLAREILGIDASVGREEIIKAHRSLMQKLHPDRGGSDYLAQKINAAKDHLLKKL
jgi:hypothetical protein